MSTSNITYTKLGTQGTFVSKRDGVVFSPMLPCSSSSSIIMSFAKEKRSLKPSANKKKPCAKGRPFFDLTPRKKTSRDDNKIGDGH